VALELADIFRQYGPAYRQKYTSRMPASHLKAMRAIEQCRTEALGGQVYRCPNCEQVQYSYHSCRNRHCPKCQNDQANQWLEEQKSLLLRTSSQETEPATAETRAPARVHLSPPTPRKTPVR